MSAPVASAPVALASVASAPRAPFVTRLRSRPGTIRMAPPGEPVITVRVQMLATWDVVRVELSPEEPVIALKVRALEALCPQAEFTEDFVLKLRGWEVADEQASVAQAGALDGSIFLLDYRRRRPIR